MIKPFLHIILLFYLQFVTAQENLVPNGSFEEFQSCPSGLADFTVSDWIPATGGSSDYFNSCGLSAVSVPMNTVGYQNAHSGNGYCGIVSGFENINENQREYIQTQLLSELTAQKEYIFSGFFSLAESSRYCIKNLGIAFSNTAIGGPYGTPIPFLPIQVFPTNSALCDTTDWVEVKISYIAQGGEKYLTIGLFFDDNSSQIELFNPLQADFGYYYIDDISVYEMSFGIIPNVLTPNNDGINDTWEVKSPSDTEFYILNRWGSTIFNGVSKSNIISWDGRDINGSNCNDGVYFYKIVGKVEVKTGFVQLIR
ncbi:T9SS type B sorting domain-containing protein [Pedobacter sp.]